MSSVVSFLLLHVVFALSRHYPDAQNTACARSGGIGTPLVYGALKVIKARDRQARIEARLARIGLISDTRHRYSAVPGNSASAGVGERRGRRVRERKCLKLKSGSNARVAREPLQNRGLQVRFLPGLFGSSPDCDQLPWRGPKTSVQRGR